MPRRQQNRRNVKPVILILSEDTGGAFTFLKQSLRFGSSSKVSIVVKPVGKGPSNQLTMAKKAVKGKQRNMPHAAAVFMVFDKDNDAHFSDVVEKANSLENIFCFTTSPCIEYYFLLHFENSSRPFTCYNEVREILCRCSGFEKYHKGDGGVPVALLHSLRTESVSNSALVRAERRAEQRKLPHSDIDVLFAICETAARDGIEAIANFDFSDLIGLDDF